jgi:hypothetical protein
VEDFELSESSTGNKAHGKSKQSSTAPKGKRDG